MGDDGGIPSERQWGYLMDVIAHDEEMLTNQFTAPNGKSRLARKWAELAVELNQLGGAVKSGERWKEAFANLKSRARKQYANRVAYMQGTGGGEHPDAIGLGMNPIYARCVTLTGRVAAVGNLNVPDPLLHQQNEQHDQQNLQHPLHVLEEEVVEVRQDAGRPQSAPPVNRRNVAFTSSKSGRGNRSSYPPANVSGVSNRSSSSSTAQLSQPGCSGISRKSYTATAPISEKSVSSVGARSYVESAAKMKSGWEKAADNARELARREALANAMWTIEDSDDDDPEWNSSAQVFPSDGRQTQNSSEDVDREPRFLTPQKRVGNEKQIHTPPWDGISPARKKLAFQNKSSASLGSHSNTSIGATTSSLQNLNLGCSKSEDVETTNDSQDLKDAIVSNTEILQIVQASMAGVIEAIQSLNVNVAALTTSLNGVDEICPAVQQLNTAVVSSELSMELNNSLLQNLNSSLLIFNERMQLHNQNVEGMLKQNVFIEGVSIAVVPSEEENNDS